MDQKWEYCTFRNGSILVEKYSGPITKNNILKTDNYIITEEYSELKKLLILCDISEATFSGLDYKEIPELLEAFKSNPDELAGTKLALYHGGNSKEDFLKFSAYSKHEYNLTVFIQSFLSLESAMNWLGFTEEEQLLASKQLSKKS